MIADAAFATGAVCSNAAFLSPLTDVTNGVALPLHGTNSTCQTEPAPRCPAISRIRIAENSEK